jgi:hypothetical protein
LAQQLFPEWRAIGVRYDGTGFSLLDPGRGGKFRLFVFALDGRAALV